MKNFKIKELERWLKTSLKNKVSINDKTVIKYLMSGIIGAFMMTSPVISYGWGVPGATLTDRYGNKYGLENDKGVSIAIGQGASAKDGQDPKDKQKGKSSIAIGNKAKAEGYQNGSSSSIAIGDSATSKGWSISIGESANSDESGISLGLFASSKKIGISLGREARSGDEAVALGYKSNAEQLGSIAIGKNSHVIHADGIAIGTDTESKWESVALGNKAKATIDGGIALGSNSITTRDKGSVGYNPNSSNNKDLNSATWTATDAALSIGNNSTKTRQITGLAAGKEDTDAVNVAQLKEVVNKLDSLGKAEGGETFAKKDGSNITEADWVKKLGDESIENGNKLAKSSEVKSYVDKIQTALQSNITQNSNDIKGLKSDKANVKLDNINDEGKKVIKNLIKVSKADGDDNIVEISEGTETNGQAKEYKLSVNKSKVQEIAKDAVEVKSEENSGIKIDTTNSNNKKTYKLSLDETKVKELAGTTNLATEYAKVDASNLDKTNETINRDKWINKLGTDNISKTITENAGKGKLTTEKAVKDYVAQEINNVNNSVSGKLSSDDVDVKGDEYISVANDINKRNHYTLTFNKAQLESDLDLSKNGTITNINTELKKKANKDASNLEENDIKNWQSKLGNGEVKEGNKGLVTGDTVHKVKTELNGRITANEGKINDINNKYNDLDKRVKTNTNEINQLKTTVNGLNNTINNKLGDINKNITNINNKLDGKLDKADLSITGDDYIKVDKKDDKFNYTLSLNKDKLASDLDLTNNTSVNKIVNNKLGDINKNLGDLKTNVENNTNSINTLTPKVETNTKNIEKLNQDMNNKLDTDAKNLTKDGETNLINKLSEGSDISNPKDRLVTDRQVNKYLGDNYYNKKNIDKMIGDVDKKSTLALEKSELALGGVANAVAMANLVQVNSYSRHRHNLSAAYGYYGGSHALAIGFSGTNEERNFIYKLSGSVNNKGNLAFGVGAGVMLGEEHDGNVDTPSHVKEQLIKSEKERQLMKTALINQEKQIKDLYRIIGELQEQLKKKH